jgi:hypothetical protein
VIAKADAALARPEPVAPTDEELLGIDELRDAWNEQADAANSWDELGLDESLCFAQQQALARFAHPTLTPIPVSERPILKRDPFNDDQGRCWCGTKACVDASGDIDVDIPPSWELREPCAQDDALLSANALPLPAAPGEEE